MAALTTAGGNSAVFKPHWFGLCSKTRGFLPLAHAGFSLVIGSISVGLLSIRNRDSLRVVIPKIGLPFREGSVGDSVSDNRWDEKAGLRTGCCTLPSYRRARSTEIKETGNEEG